VSKPRFDSTINLGQILTILSLVASGFGAFYGVKLELATISTRLEMVERTMSQMATVLIVQGRQDERLNALERRIRKEQ
jgi:hypothetical protein